MTSKGIQRLDNWIIDWDRRMSYQVVPESIDQYIRYSQLTGETDSVDFYELPEEVQLFIRMGQ